MGQPHFLPAASVIGQCWVTFRVFNLEALFFMVRALSAIEGTVPLSGAPQRISILLSVGEDREKIGHNGRRSPLLALLASI